jgi:hypothetical protein
MEYDFKEDGEKVDWLEKAINVEGRSSDRN